MGILDQFDELDRDDQFKRKRAVTGIRGAQKKSAALRKAMTHCKRGHEYTPENTYRYGSVRDCRECRKIRHAERKLSATNPCGIE